MCIVVYSPSHLPHTKHQQHRHQPHSSSSSSSSSNTHIYIHLHLSLTTVISVFFNLISSSIAASLRLSKGALLSSPLLSFSVLVPLLSSTASILPPSHSSAHRVIPVAESHYHLRLCHLLSPLVVLFPVVCIFIRLSCPALSLVLLPALSDHPPNPHFWLVPCLCPCLCLPPVQFDRARNGWPEGDIHGSVKRGRWDQASVLRLDISLPLRPALSSAYLWSSCHVVNSCPHIRCLRVFLLLFLFLFLFCFIFLFFIHHARLNCLAFLALLLRSLRLDMIFTPHTFPLVLLLRLPLVSCPMSPRHAWPPPMAAARLPSRLAWSTPTAYPFRSSLLRSWHHRSQAGAECRKCVITDIILFGPWPLLFPVVPSCCFFPPLISPVSPPNKQGRAKKNNEGQEAKEKIYTRYKSTSISASESFDWLWERNRGGKKFEISILVLGFFSISLLVLPLSSLPFPLLF